MNKNEAGFTIVELITTIIVLGVVITSIGTFSVYIQTSQRQSNYKEAATRAAQKEIEALRNNNYNSLTAGSNIDFTSNLPSSLPPGKSGIVTVTEPMPGLKRVDVSVTYPDSGTREVRLSSLIGVLGITQ